MEVREGRGGNGQSFDTHHNPDRRPTPNVRSKKQQTACHVPGLNRPMAVFTAVFVLTMPEGALTLTSPVPSCCIPHIPNVHDTPTPTYENSALYIHTAPCVVAGSHAPHIQHSSSLVCFFLSFLSARWSHKQQHHDRAHVARRTLKLRQQTPCGLQLALACIRASVFELLVVAPCEKLFDHLTCCRRLKLRNHVTCDKTSTVRRRMQPQIASERAGGSSSKQHDHTTFHAST